MGIRGIRCVALAWALALAVFNAGLRAEDWPGFRGPNRDGICQEKGLLAEWPKGGPKLLWTARGLGVGNSTPSVVGNVLYVMGEKNDKEWVMALDVSKQGKVVWESAIGPVRNDGNGFPGPRSTPTIDGNRLYTMGLAGDIVCMNTKTGKILWHRDLVKDYGGTVPSWGYAESVLVDGPWVVCTPGGAKNTIAALNKNNGRLVWGSPVGERAEYASVIKVMVGRQKQYVNLMKKGVVAVAAKDGRFLWRYDAPASRTANCSTCVTSGDTVFASCGYGMGGGLVRIEPEGKGFSAKQVYFTKRMQNHHGGMVLVDGFLYGCSDPSILTCIEYKTGKVKWQDRSSGKCSVLWVDGMLYCRSESGPISLVEATPKGFKLKGRFDQPERSDRNSWPYLVISNGVMYVHDQDVLLAYDVRGE
jgi:outer membrane protein assembly factor BamB